jgi:hypothetical protein
MMFAQASRRGNPGGSGYHGPEGTHLPSPGGRWRRVLKWRRGWQWRYCSV